MSVTSCLKAWELNCLESDSYWFLNEFFEWGTSYFLILLPPLFARFYLTVSSVEGVLAEFLEEFLVASIFFFSIMKYLCTFYINNLLHQAWETALGLRVLLFSWRIYANELFLDLMPSSYYLILFIVAADSLGWEFFFSSWIFALIGLLIVIFCRADGLFVFSNLAAGFGLWVILGLWYSILT